MVDDQDQLTALAKDVYTAYGRVTGFKNHQGNPMPAWDELGSTIQDAWRAVAVEAYDTGYRDGEAGTWAVTGL